MTPKLLNILLIVLSWLLYSYVVDPLYSGTPSFLFDDGQSFKSLIEKRNAYDKTIAEVPKIKLQAEEARKNFGNILDDDKKKILTMVPTEVNDIKFMSEITNIGNESGVPLDGMGIKNKGNGEYSVSFSITTTYTNFKNLIKVWENSMRLFTLQSVTFSPGKTEEEPIKFSVELSSYYMK